MDMQLINQLFETDPGYVLDFSNNTFATFFSELKIDIYADAYGDDGGSKGKRFRCFLRKTDNATAVRVLNALWEYRKEWLYRHNQSDKVVDAHRRFLGLIGRLGGASPQAQQTQTAKRSISPAKFSELLANLMNLSNMGPQARGYAFEKYLKELFDAFGLEARSPFKLVGEQIDGSFLLGNETYLLEAKWQNEHTRASDLRAFNGKVEEKAQWSRGLFVSYIGFSEDGLTAFGRGKRIICLDGFDLSETLSRRLDFDKVLERKVRHAAETGNCFGRVRNLF